MAPPEKKRKRRPDYLILAKHVSWCRTQYVILFLLVPWQVPWQFQTRPGPIKYSYHQKRAATEQRVMTLESTTSALRLRHTPGPREWQIQLSTALAASRRAPQHKNCPPFCSSWWIIRSTLCISRLCMALIMRTTWGLWGKNLHAWPTLHPIGLAGAVPYNTSRSDATTY